MAIVRDFKIGLIMLDFISIRLAKCETLAKYCNHKHCRWLSEDPALNEYIPKAPIDDKAKKDNENLPGMGGVYTTQLICTYTITRGIIRCSILIRMGEQIISTI